MADEKEAQANIAGCEHYDALARRVTRLWLVYDGSDVANLCFNNNCVTLHV